MSWIARIGLTALACAGACGDEVVTGAAESSGVDSTGASEDSSGSEASGSTAVSSESSDGGSGSSTGEAALEPAIPVSTARCPDLVAGDVLFSPQGVEPRLVKLWMSDAAADMDGPLVFYWHGTGGVPEEAEFGLGAEFIADVVDQGGIVAAPYADLGAGDFPWYLVLGDQDLDMLVADEVLGCAHEQLGVDTRRIHSLGFSAGAINTAQMSWRRSGYLASVVTYSGGFFVDEAPPDQEPDNNLAAMIFHGGVNDVVIIGFQDASERYLESLRATDRFGFLCNHNMRHSIPQGVAQASVWQFFFDHPWDTTPSPYEGGLPAGFPDYCTL